MSYYNQFAGHLAGAAIAAFTNTTSISHDGVNQFIRFPNGCFNALTGGTIGVWVHPTSLATNNKTIFCASIGTATSDNVSIFINTSGQVVILGRTGAVNHYLGVCTTTTISINNWYFITWSCNPHRIQINGIDQTISFSSGNVNTVTYFADVAAAGTVLYTIGNLRRNTNANFFAGYIDEPVFFNVGLSVAEMTELYNGGVVYDYATHSQAANIVSAYRHGDGAGDVYPTSEDYIGANDGTMENMSAANFVSVVP